MTDTAVLEASVLAARDHLNRCMAAAISAPVDATSGAYDEALDNVTRARRSYDEAMEQLLNSY